jgi:hypothetical protein
VRRLSLGPWEVGLGVRVGGVWLGYLRKGLGMRGEGVVGCWRDWGSLGRLGGGRGGRGKRGWGREVVMRGKGKKLGVKG